MGKRGPQPKPTAQKQLEGNPGKRPLPDNELKPDGLVRIPNWLNEREKTVWRRVLKAMPDGFITAADVDALARYCCWMVEFVAAKKIGDRHAMKEADIRCERAAKQFGLSPADRVGLSNPKTAKESKLGVFLGETG